VLQPEFETDKLSVLDQECKDFPTTKNLGAPPNSRRQKVDMKELYREG
jgi:hypothetical protein